MTAAKRVQKLQKANLEPVEEAVVSSKISGQGTKVNSGYGIRWSGVVFPDDQSLQNQPLAALINQQKLQTTLKNFSEP